MSALLAKGRELLTEPIARCKRKRQAWIGENCATGRSYKCYRTTPSGELLAVA